MRFYYLLSCGNEGLGGDLSWSSLKETIKFLKRIRNNERFKGYKIKFKMFFK